MQNSCFDMEMLQLCIYVKDFHLNARIQLMVICVNAIFYFLNFIIVSQTNTCVASCYLIFSLLDYFIGFVIRLVPSTGIAVI